MHALRSPHRKIVYLGENRGVSMAAAIGLRVYQMFAQRVRGRKPIDPRSTELNVSAPAFVSNFIPQNQLVVQHDELERSWFFDPKGLDDVGNSTGYIQYGTFGFESNLISSKTKTTNYRRQVDDIEEIPLFYETWFPPDAQYGLMSIQSFQARSCVSVVQMRMQKAFEAVNPGYSLRFRKLMPNDVSGSLYYKAPVKRLTLIKRNASADITDRYFNKKSHIGIDFSVSLTARRNSSLGDLGSVLTSMGKGAAGIVAQEGIDFGEAIAEIKVGGKLRRVGVFGGDSEAGLIDLTDAVSRGADGHPQFESIAAQSDVILQDFYSTLTGAVV